MFYLDSILSRALTSITSYMCICPSVLKLYYHGSVGVEVYADVIIWHTTVAWYKGIPLCIIYMYYICGCVSRINALSCHGAVVL